MIKVALAEDNPYLASSIQEKIELFATDLKFKFHAGNGQQMLDKLEKDSNIDVILMDIQMPLMDGIAATEIVTQKYPHIQVVMLTVFDDEQHIADALRAGAQGYLLKETAPLKLKDYIIEAHQNGVPMNPEIANSALKIIRNPDMLRKPSTVKIELSSREKEVLQQISQGLEYKTIAENLNISPSTVRKHTENLYSKMEVHNKIEAIQKANKMGLLK